MQIGKHWKIEQTDTNTVLVFGAISQTGDHKGEIYWVNEAYFAPTLDGIRNALKFIADRGVSETQLGELKTILAAQSATYALIDGLDLSMLVPAKRTRTSKTAEDTQDELESESVPEET